MVQEMGGSAATGLNRRLMAEGIGTFVLVLFGTGAIVVGQTYPETITHGGISLVFGAVVTILVLMYGEISGAHLNPAVTLGLLVAGKVRWQEVWAYLPVQALSAVLASLCVSLLFPLHPHLGATIPKVGYSSSWGIEMLMTAILMLVILKYPAVPGLAQFKPFAVGGVIFLEAMVAGPLTGASMNPARSLGPALISGKVHDLWLYLTAPVAGTLLVAVLTILTKGSNRK